MCKEITLHNGMKTIVDDDVFEVLNKFKWRAIKSRNGVYYAGRYIHSPKKGDKPRYEFIHRIVLYAPVGLVTDHIDGDGLNNQKANLRVVTPRVNSQNRHNIKKSSKYPGVHYHKLTGKWRSQIYLNGKIKSLGLFHSEIEAAKAYSIACGGGDHL